MFKALRARDGSLNLHSIKLRVIYAIFRYVVFVPEGIGDMYLLGLQDPSMSYRVVGYLWQDLLISWRSSIYQYAGVI